MDPTTKTIAGVNTREHESWWDRRKKAGTFLDHFPRIPVFNRLVEYIKESSKSTLDCGCGVCAAYPYIIKEEIEYTGVDFTQKFLDEAQTRYPEANLKYGSILDLPFPNRSFDSTFCEAVLEHLHPDDLPKAVSEMMRVARKRVIFGFFRSPTPKPTQVEWYGYYMNTYNKTEWLTLLIRDPRIMGFKLERLGRYGFYVVDLR